MANQDNIFFWFYDVMEGFKLTDSHGLVLDQVKINHIAVKSINTDES